jgi:hypothetical protein
MSSEEIDVRLPPERRQNTDRRQAERRQRNLPVEVERRTGRDRRSHAERRVRPDPGDPGPV